MAEGGRQNTVRTSVRGGPELMEGVQLSGRTPRRKKKHFGVLKFKSPKRTRLGTPADFSSDSSEDSSEEWLSSELSAIRYRMRFLSEDPEKRHSTIRKCRQYFLRYGRDRLEPFIKHGVIDQIGLALYSEHRETREEATWALLHFTSSNKYELHSCVTSQIIEGLLIQIDYNEDDNNIETALTVLGNLVMNDKQTRDRCLSNGILTYLQKVVEQDVQIGVTRECARVYAELLRFNPIEVPSNDWTSYLKAVRIYLRQPDKYVLRETSFFTANLTFISDELTHQLYKSDILERLVSMLLTEESSTVRNCVVVIGNFMAVCENEITEILNSEVLTHLVALMRSYRENLRRQVYWALCNAVADKSEVVGRLIEAGAIARLMEILKRDIAVRVPALVLAEVITHSADEEQNRIFIQGGFLRRLCLVLGEKDDRDVENASCAIANILKKAKNAEAFSDMVAELGLVDYIDACQFSAGSRTRRAMVTLRTYSNHCPTSPSTRSSAKPSSPP